MCNYRRCCTSTTLKRTYTRESVIVHNLLLRGEGGGGGVRKGGGEGVEVEDMRGKGGERERGRRWGGRPKAREMGQGGGAGEAGLEGRRLG